MKGLIIKDRQNNLTIEPFFSLNRIEFYHLLSFKGQEGEVWEFEIMNKRDTGRKDKRGVPIYQVFLRPIQRVEEWVVSGHQFKLISGNVVVKVVNAITETDYEVGHYDGCIYKNTTFRNPEKPDMVWKNSEIVWKPWMEKFPSDIPQEICEQAKEVVRKRKEKEELREKQRKEYAERIEREILEFVEHRKEDLDSFLREAFREGFEIRKQISDPLLPFGGEPCTWVWYTKNYYIRFHLNELTFYDEDYFLSSSPILPYVSEKGLKLVKVASKLGYKTIINELKELISKEIINIEFFEEAVYLKDIEKKFKKKLEELPDEYKRIFEDDICKIIVQYKRNIIEPQIKTDIEEHGLGTLVGEGRLTSIRYAYARIYYVPNCNFEWKIKVADWVKEKYKSWSIT